MPTPRSFVIFLVFSTGLSQDSCSTSSDFGIVYNGSKVFQVIQANSTCACVNFAASSALTGSSLSLSGAATIAGALSATSLATAAVSVTALTAANATLSTMSANNANLGSVVLLNTGATPTCTSGLTGTMRYTGSNLVFCDGTKWRWLSGVGPTISGVVPASGTFAGGTTVVISGTGFSPSSAVRIGGVLASSVTVTSSTSITIVTPASSSSGLKTVEVTTELGQSSSTSPGFTYRGDGSTPQLAEFSCLSFIQNGLSRGDGIYWITAMVTLNSGANQPPTLVYCDQTTAGGGWTLIGHNTIGGFYHKQMPSLRCGGGTYDGLNRASTGSLPSATLARASTLIAFAQASPRQLQTGNMMQYDQVTYFAIPNPSIVTFEAHSRDSPGWSSMVCRQVTVNWLKGGSGTLTRYTLDKSLGVTWTDSYPTGYGCLSTPGCQNPMVDGPMVQSALSGAFHGTGSCSGTGAGGCSMACDYIDGALNYNYQGMYLPTTYNIATGTNTIWLK